MPIKAQITREALSNSEDVKVHFVPASIDGNGSIKIDEFFSKFTTENANVKINALRGYPLKGVDVKLPMNLQGVILRENEKLGLERELKFGGKFDEFTYWNYDKIPSENDAYRKALHWIKISEAVHTEVDSLD